MSKFVIAAVALVGMVGVVDADSTAVWPLRDVGDTLKTSRATLITGHAADAECREKIKAATEAGATPTETFTSEGLQWVPKAYKAKEDRDNWTLTFANAGLLCDEIAKLVALQPAMGALERAASDLDSFKRHAKSGVTQSELTPQNIERLQVDRKDCRPAVPVIQSAARAYGVQHLKFAYLDPKPVADLASICDALDTGFAPFAKQVEDNEKEEAEAWAAAEAPYKKAGATGEKLEFLTKMDGTAIYGVGGREITTPKAKVAAKVMFEVLSGGGSVTVRKYVWKGTKLVEATQREYAVRPGAGAFK